jgi:hypothetical protein
MNYKMAMVADEKKYPEILKEWFKHTVGYDLNLENPQTYNEKIQWLKLYDSTPLKTKLSDKYLVRDWVKEKIGEKYLIPLIGVYDKFEDIDFNGLPNKFVIKANHGSGWNVIVKDKAALNIAERQKEFKDWMSKNFAYVFGLELQYKNIVPKIIIEEYLENNNDELYDYKIWCFDGKPKYILFASGRKQSLKLVFFDTNWGKQEFWLQNYPINKEEIKKPDNLNEMLSLSEVLSKGFAHVRVDFYRLNDGTIKFGEMTFSTASGVCRWNPPKYDLELGKLIKLPKDNPNYGHI